MSKETVRPQAEMAVSQEEENRDHRFYRKGFHDGQVKAQAEVLAACINALEERRAYHERQAEILQSECKHRQVPYHELQEHHLAVALEALKDVQPAASGLKELLRQAELKGLLASEHDSTFEETITGGRITRHDSRCCKCKRITELEKARAIEER